MNLDKKSFVIVTGASRGLGRSIAVALAKEIGENSTILLLARSMTGLEETKKVIADSCGTKALKVETHSVDNEVADRSTFENGISQAADGDKNFEIAILVHNAGSLGPQGVGVKDLHDCEQLKTYFSSNVFSLMALNAAFMSFFDSTYTRIIVNISSLAALQPFETWSLYCMGKSARDMLFSVLATEEKDDDKLKILNYAPGPLDTVMIEEVMSSPQTHPNILKSFESMKQRGQLIQTDDSASKMVQLIVSNKFKNGSHIDFFEVDDLLNSPE